VADLVLGRGRRAPAAGFAGLAGAADLPRYPLLAAARGGGDGEPAGQGGVRL